MDIQLKRGLLDVCVLAAIRNEDSYGYKIIKDMSPYIEISESTLYTILKRLEAGKLLIVWTAEHGGRLRKYYRITPGGIDRIEEFKSDWKEIEAIYRFITRDAQNRGNTPEAGSTGSLQSEGNTHFPEPLQLEGNISASEPLQLGSDPFEGPNVNRFSFGPEEKGKEGHEYD